MLIISSGTPCSSFPINGDIDLTHWHAHAGWLVSSSQWAQLLHAIPQHLIGCDEHDADNECHGKGADEALPHARLTVLL